MESVGKVLVHEFGLSEGREIEVQMFNLARRFNLILLPPFWQTHVSGLCFLDYCVLCRFSLHLIINIPKVKEIQYEINVPVHIPILGNSSIIEIVYINNEMEPIGAFFIK